MVLNPFPGFLGFVCRFDLRNGFLRALVSSSSFFSWIFAFQPLRAPRFARALMMMIDRSVYILVSCCFFSTWEKFWNDPSMEWLRRIFFLLHHSFSFLKRKETTGWKCSKSFESVVCFQLLEYWLKSRNRKHICMLCIYILFGVFERSKKRRRWWRKLNDDRF